MNGLPQADSRRAENPPLSARRRDRETLSISRKHLREEIAAGF
jgi:hypothetical protein